ncbi:MAG: hypothetical protein QXD04_05590 [Candidatus Bathyarchaeia archaeon]
MARRQSYLLPVAAVLLIALVGFLYVRGLPSLPPEGHKPLAERVRVYDAGFNIWLQLRFERGGTEETIDDST